MTGAESMRAIRSVHDAAIGLTLACTEAVGAVAMAVSLPSARLIGEPVPDAMTRQVEVIEDREKKQ